MNRCVCVVPAVSRATLHNQDFINDLDIGIGDTIVVYKSGEIIPKIKEVRREKRPAALAAFPDTGYLSGLWSENCPGKRHR